MSLEIINSCASLEELEELEKGDKAGHPFYGNQHKGGEGGAPIAPKLSGPKAQAAIRQIQAAAATGDPNAVANVSTFGTHPQVTAYRDAMAEHVGGRGQVLTNILSGK